MVADNN